MAGRLQHYTLTLSGAAQALSTVTGLGTNQSIRTLILQPDTANTHVCYVGGAAVSSAAHAFRMEAPTATIPPAPFVLDGYDIGLLRPSEIFIIGTAAEIVHIGIIEK